MDMTKAYDSPTSRRERMVTTDAEAETTERKVDNAFSMAASCCDPRESCLASDAGQPHRSLSPAGHPSRSLSPRSLSTRYGELDLRPRRRSATREGSHTLKTWLREHRKHPYPTKGEKVMLAVITKMTLTQVSTWFANARRRLKKEKKVKRSSKRADDDKPEDNKERLLCVDDEDSQNPDTDNSGLNSPDMQSDNSSLSPAGQPTSLQKEPLDNGKTDESLHMRSSTGCNGEGRDGVSYDSGQRPDSESNIARLKFLDGQQWHPTAPENRPAGSDSNVNRHTRVCEQEGVMVSNSSEVGVGADSSSSPPSSPGKTRVASGRKIWSVAEILHHRQTPPESSYVTSSASMTSEVVTEAQAEEDGDFGGSGQAQTRPSVFFGWNFGWLNHPSFTPATAGWPIPHGYSGSLSYF